MNKRCRSVIMMVSIAWLIPLIMVAICFRMGDPETLFTSPNKLENVNYTNLRLNNSIVRGTVIPFFLPFFENIIIIVHMVIINISSIWPHLGNHLCQFDNHFRFNGSIYQISYQKGICVCTSYPTRSVLSNSKSSYTAT